MRFVVLTQRRRSSLLQWQRDFVECDEGPINGCSSSCHSWGRGVPHPRPLDVLTVPRAHPLNDNLTGDGQFGLAYGVAFGVVLGDGLGVTFGVVPGILGSSSGMSAGSP